MNSEKRDAMQSVIFDEYGCFFAFSDQQFASHRVEGVEYMRLGAGLICPRANAKEFLEVFEQANKEFNAEVVAEHGKAKIICFELWNHEYGYTYDITDTVEAVADYGITAHDVATVAPLYLSRCSAWEEFESNKSDEDLERKYREACSAIDEMQFMNTNKGVSMRKRCAIGVVVDCETNVPVLIYEGENVDVDLPFNHCPKCG